MAAVQQAKKAGLLPALILCQCVDCGRWPAQVYDHRDYSKPNEVEPVCQSCNLKRGRAKWEVPAELVITKKGRRIPKGTPLFDVPQIAGPALPHLNPMSQSGCAVSAESALSSQRLPT